MVIVKADLLQIVVARPQNQEATSLGAALAAGIAVGFYSETEIGNDGHSATQFAPSISLDASERRYSKWKKAVERSLDLSDLAL